ncbi:YlbD family protein [Aquibacillus sp. 3ASR75-11]|uniref:YlbD family protein n=1 Tax=Terrihalobacillus insolitus TaxID=2950438 RepID=A0A9X4AL19_9BACI|nr:spore coat protein YlbD [Terrihalobacillus insolitus]MDC3412807.1 YlbD family protein [Terrihalobacillus insolitus]MDC3423716.1 YlbD family protein [Terrihalobacillus insolitus]
MADKQLDSSVEKFKSFVKSHPELIRKVKQSGESWQPYYEKWVLLGEDDPYWENYKKVGEKKGIKKKSQKSAKKNKQKELVENLMKIAEKIDVEKVQGHIEQLNGAVSNIQQLVGQYQDYKKQKSGVYPPYPPYYMNKD